MIRLIMLTLVLLLSSCVSLPKCSQVIAAEDLSSRIIIYRESALLGFADAQNISLNECRMGNLWNGSYLVQDVPAGKHTIHVLDDFGKTISSFVVLVEEKEDFYLKWSFEVEDVYIGGAVAGTTVSHYFKVVDKELAVNELKKLNNI